MGDTGPCGPSSEIFYDHGPDILGGPPGSDDADGDRYIEIWNLVFMQYNRDINGNLISLPKPSVDTGMGLERIAAVLQGVHSNYEIDLFRNLIEAVANTLNINDLKNKSLQVIADHLRSCTFLVADGVLPSNEGRGYVLRRIMRRAIRHGYKIGKKDIFFYKLVPFLIKEMSDVFVAGQISEKQIMHIFEREEVQFRETLEQGLKILSTVVENSTNNIIAGKEVFKLYDTYGFPVDLTADIAREKNMSLDLDGFELAMQEQKERARKSHQFSINAEQIKIDLCTKFTGYAQYETNAKIIAIYKGENLVDTLNENEEGFIVLDQTPFYAESGGQVGDRGQLLHKNNIFNVKDTKKIKRAFAHYGVVESGEIKN